MAYSAALSEVSRAVLGVRGRRRRGYSPAYRVFGGAEGGLAGCFGGARQAAALAAALELLEGMGFGDRARNEALLRRHGNDVQVRRFDHWSNDEVSETAPPYRLFA